MPNRAAENSPNFSAIWIRRPRSCNQQSMVLHGIPEFYGSAPWDPGTVLSGSCARIWKSQEGTAALTVVTWVALMTCCCKMLRVLSAGARASTRPEHSSGPSGHVCNCILLVSISKQDPRTDGLRTSRHISGSGIASTSGRARSEGH